MTQNVDLIDHADVTAAADYCSTVIDAAADAKRNTYVPDSQQATYGMTYSDALAYITAGYPFASIAGYPLLHAAAKAYYGSDTPIESQVADHADALTAHAYYTTFLPAIERQRGRIVDLYTRANIPAVLDLTSHILWSLKQPPLD